MPEALATSKRKFYKFLDNLSAPATSSPSTTTASKRPLSEASYTNASAISVLSSASQAARVEPTAKRLRPSTSSTTVNSLRTLHARNASSTSLSSIRSRHTIAEGAKTIDASTSTDSEKKTPHFSPWSHETFLQRLKTFASVTQWYPKPDAVNEVEWAKRGWQCVDINTVGCKGGCGKRVIVRLDPLERRRIAAGETEGADGDDNQTPDDHEQDNGNDDDDLDAQFETALVAKYRDLILDGHGESCLWRKARCKDDIYRLPVVRSAIWQADVRSRYTSLLSISSSITNITLATPDIEPAPALLLRDLPPHILPIATDTDLHNRSLALALTGWTAHNEARTPLLSCAACFQRIGLWLYQPEYVRPPSSHSELEGEDASGVRDLDPVEMHREHCPWRNGASQAATGEYKGQPAWRILWSVVARFADETRRRSRVVAIQEAATPVDATAGNAPSVGDQEEGEVEGEDYDELDAPPQMSREEIQRLDKERITKLRKLKRMFSVKRKAPGGA